MLFKDIYSIANITMQVKYVVSNFSAEREILIKKKAKSLITDTTLPEFKKHNFKREKNYIYIYIYLNTTMD